jgi:hypothetical protein
MIPDDITRSACLSCSMKKRENKAPNAEDLPFSLEVPARPTPNTLQRMQRDRVHQERRPQQGEVRIERLAQNQLVRKLGVRLRFAEEPFQALSTLWAFEPLHLGPEFSSVGG